jgi:uncharacterized protein (DUF1330 family)
MSRGLILFVGLMLALVVVLGIGIWWLGPTLAHLAFVDARRDQAYVVVDLARPEDLDRHAARYGLPLIELVRSEEGELIGDYRLSHVMSGRVDDEWQRMQLYRFTAATDLVQVLTSTPYRVMFEQIEGTGSLKLGSFDLPKDAWRPAVVVWLVDQRDAGTLDPLRELVALAEGAEGRLVWDAQVDAVERPGTWNRVVVVDFPDTETALAWLRSDTAATERTLSRSRVEGLALLVFSAPRSSV